MDCPSTITEVVQAVNYEILNLTIYVANCENVCIIMFRHGNPIRYLNSDVFVCFNVEMMN
jgi:hypothetical protein